MEIKDFGLQLSYLTPASPRGALAQSLLTLTLQAVVAHVEIWFPCSKQEGKKEERKEQQMT